MIVSSARRLLSVATVLALLACADAPTTLVPEGTPAPVAALLRAWPEASGTPPILVGAGDIAKCYDPADPLSVTPPAETPAGQTARLLDRIPGIVYTAGDNAYEYGSPYDYMTCYDPTWGRHRQRTRPSAGNHEYLTPGAAGYFAYFGPAAHPPLGYYSYDVGDWHVVVLNSTPQWALCPPRDATDQLPPPASPGDGRACVGDRLQQLWLAADLAANPRRCTLVYFHHPRFSSGKHGPQYEMQQFWDIMYVAGVDVVISAHDHLYERFAPQDPEGRADPLRGIRQFVVGTGGAPLYPFETILANSEVRNNDTHGVLAVALGSGEYGWAFVPVEGRSFTDYGRGLCH